MSGVRVGTHLGAHSFVSTRAPMWALPLVIVGVLALASLAGLYLILRALVGLLVLSVKSYRRRHPVAKHDEWKGARRCL